MIVSPSLSPQGEPLLFADGSATVSIRGAARLLGVSETAIRQGTNLNNTKLAETLTQKGFDARSFASEGIPDRDRRLGIIEKAQFDGSGHNGGDD